MSNYGLGMTLAEMGRCADALPVIDRALAADGFMDYKAEVYKRQAVCLARGGQPGAARAAIAQARRIFADVPELAGTTWEIEVDRAEAEVLAALGEHEQAFALMETFADRALALAHDNASQSLIKLRVSMEDERKELEIRLLKQQSRVDALELDRERHANRVQRNTTVLLVALLLAVVTIVLLQMRNTRKLRELSTRDALTGLCNRRHVFELLDRITQHLPADRGQLSVMLVDVDNFKLLNDRHGHPAGDQVLKQIAAIGARVLRAEDCMARIGGEEFLCVLPRTSAENAMLIAGRFIEQVRAQEFSLSTEDAVRVTVSIGVASFGPECVDATQLYTRADEALYESKRAGRDRVTLGSPGSPVEAPSP